MKIHATTLNKVALGVFASCTLGVLAIESPVSAAPVTLEDFEDDLEGDYPNDWDVFQERVVLGDTAFESCTSPDFADYSNLNGLLANGSLYGPQGSSTPSFGTVGSGTHTPYSYFREWRAPTESSQYSVGGTLPMWWYDGDYGFAPNGTYDDYPESFWNLSGAQREELLTLQAESLRDLEEDPQWPFYDDAFDVTVLDGTGYGINWDSQVLQLYIGTEAYPGHVVHGPAVVSQDTFTVTGEAEISFWFGASADMDDYHVYGYLQSTTGCSQIELFDATGAFRAWDRIVVDDIPAGTYRFIFVGGTYDGTWGALGGARLWIDDILCEGEAAGANGTCTLDTDCDDCGTSVGEGLELSQIRPLPTESGPRVDIDVDYLNERAAAGSTDQLPKTGFDAYLFSLAATLLVLGSGLVFLRRRLQVAAIRHGR